MPRRRVHAFEFEDQPWFPAELRGYLTDILHAAHRVFRVYRLWAPRIAELMEQTGERRLVDLCSGGGGPALAIADLLRQRGLAPDLTLTDLYPNHTARARINGAGRPDLRYRAEAVDATRVPAELGGIRTLFVSFHHMPRDAARSILADACRQRRCICIFELTDNTLHAAASYLLSVPLLTWGLTPLTRPLTARRLLLTYGLPVMPFLVTWDGVASHLRTYSAHELLALTEGLDEGGYRWEAGHLWHLPIPYKLPYLIGRPGA